MELATGSNERYLAATQRNSHYTIIVVVVKQVARFQNI